MSREAIEITMREIHSRNRETLLAVLPLLVEARTKLDTVGDINGQSPYFKVADAAHGHIDTAIQLIMDTMLSAAVVDPSRGETP